MQPSRLLLALGLSFIFSQSAYSQFAALRQASPPEILPTPRQHQQLEFEHERPDVAFVVPKERAVTVNLSLDRPPIPRKAQFKFKRSGQVLAELSQHRPEQLEFEVVIEGPVCDVPVYLPVSPYSKVSAAYAKHGVDHPDLVVEELAKLGVPDVSVIAILRGYATERYDGDGPLGVDLFHTWIPYYRVAYKEAASPPLLVRVPRQDWDLYRMMAKSLADNLDNDFQMVVLTISEGNFDSGLPPCHCHEHGYSSCRCYPEPDYYRSETPREEIQRRSTPQPGSDGQVDGPMELPPAERAPEPSLPTDPFTDDEA